MSNKKISELNENLSPSGDNILPIVASGTTDYISLSGLSNFITSGFTNTFWSASTGVNSIVSTFNNNIASGNTAYAEGGNNTALGDYSHAEGFGNIAGPYSHVEGYGNVASGDTSHAEGGDTYAGGQRSHTEGWKTTTSGLFSHAEGSYTSASGDSAHSEGSNTTAIGNYSHSEGINTTAFGDVSHTEGNLTSALGYASHAEGGVTIASGSVSHSEGENTTASGEASHAEGNGSIASGSSSHAEGNITTASGNFSHSEGNNNTALGVQSHVGGANSIASGNTSFVHGNSSVANGDYSIVLGSNITGNANNTTYVEDLVIKKFASIPTGTGDAIGENGSVTWDNSNFYWKANGQWLVISGMTFGDLPVLTTTSISGAFYPQATSGGDITYEGTSPVTAYGVVWSQSPNPTLSDSFTVDGSGSGSFVSTLTGITSYSTNYYVRAYATNTNGTAYGNQQVFQLVPCLAEGTKIRLSDNTYKNIEDVIYDDELLVWDFDFGTFETAKPLWIKTPETTDRYNKLTFSDGTVLKTIGQHRIFNIERGEFTYPMTDNTPIGTTTFNANGEKITLVNKELILEEINFYNIMTDKFINLFAEDILTSSRYSNIYPVVDMKFVKDDRTLKTRKEFANISDKYYYGLRLNEQKLTIDEIERGVRMLEKLEIKLELA